MQLDKPATFMCHECVIKLGLPSARLKRLSSPGRPARSESNVWKVGRESQTRAMQYFEAQTMAGEVT